MGGEMYSECGQPEAEHRHAPVGQRPSYSQMLARGPQVTRKVIATLGKNELVTELVNEPNHVCGYVLKSRTVWVLCSLLLLFTTSLCGCIIFWCTSMFDDVLKSHLVLTNGTLAYESWARPPVKTRIGVHIFNYTNIDEFTNKQADKLRVQDVGPYTYIETNERVNQVFHDDGTVSYQEYKVFEYSQRHSKHLRESDVLTVPNMPMLGAVTMHRNSTLVTKVMFNGLFKGLSAQPFLQVTARDFTWGYQDRFFDLVRTMMSFQKPIPFEKFGILAMRNASRSHVYTIETGANNVENVQVLKKLNGKEKMEYWHDECNHINGTDGSAFSPNLVRNKQRVHLYQKDVCRKLPFDFQGEVKLLKNTTTAYRYVLSKKLFDDPEIEPSNHCYCKNERNCPISGVFDLSRCALGPVLLSFPHFLYGDPSLTESIDGLKPDENKHFTYLDLNPLLGYSMQGHSRFQINIHAGNVYGMTQTDIFKEDIILPVAWFDVGVDEDELPQSILEVIERTSVSVPRIERSLRYGSALLCATSLAVMALVLLKCTAKVRRSRRHILQRNRSGMDSLIPT